MMKECNRCKKETLQEWTADIAVIDHYHNDVFGFVICVECLSKFWRFMERME